MTEFANNSVDMANVGLPSDVVANADADLADAGDTAADANAASTGEASHAGATAAEAAPPGEASAQVAPTESAAAEAAPAEIGDSASDGLTSKLAIIAGIASLVAVGVVVFFSLRGAVYYDALKGPIIKNTYVRFGRFIQNKKEPEPIIWLVADIQGDEAFLISQKILDWRKFNDQKLEDEEMPYWETSSLREYLNSDFYNTAFNDEEKERICVSRLKNLPAPSNSKITLHFARNRQASAADTDDKVFIPSFQELDELMPARSGKKYRLLNKAWRATRTMVTQHAIDRGALRDRSRNHFLNSLFNAKVRSPYYPYWLRTHYFYWHMMIVSDEVRPGRCDNECGVRPALRMRVK